MEETEQRHDEHIEQQDPGMDLLAAQREIFDISALNIFPQKIDMATTQLFTREVRECSLFLKGHFSGLQRNFMEKKMLLNSSKKCP